MDNGIPATDWIAYHARTTPDGVACIDLASSRRFTYAAFDARISRLANVLRGQLGLKIPREGDLRSIEARLKRWYDQHRQGVTPDASPVPIGCGNEKRSALLLLRADRR